MRACVLDSGDCKRIKCVQIPNVDRNAYPACKKTAELKKRERERGREGRQREEVRGKERKERWKKGSVRIRFNSGDQRYRTGLGMNTKWALE